MPEAATKLKIHRFDQMAVQVKDKVHPSEADVDRYVGLEHLDPESLKIRRWGEPSDVESSKILFRSGDIIFGKRRAYQRKLVVADFDGICSAHAMVLRPKTEVVLKEFLPFFMQTDAFMERAVKISVGGLSPTINWKALAREEFALPPMEEQHRLAAALTATDVAISAQEDLAVSLSRLLGSIADTFLGACVDYGSVGDVVTSTAYGSSKKSVDGDVGVPILGIPNVRRGRLDLESFNRVELTDSEVARYGLAEGDVLLVRTNGNPHYVGRCVVVEDLPHTCIYASYLIRIRVDPSKILPAFLSTILNAPSVRRELRGTVRSSAGNYNINTTEIKDQAIPLPMLNEQQAFLDRIAALKGAQNGCDQRLAGLRHLKASLLREANL
ncbi:MAG: restriction endonuclease subunit S [Polyangiaceae bacterium]|nr:restriction endonuclease subunit S [Polyangiaceae bacterium]